MSYEESEALVTMLKITNERGLHARASAKFVKLSENFDAKIEVSRNDITANGGSIMGLMMLGAATGTEIKLSCTGKEAKAAQKAIIELVENKFDEE